MVSNTQLRGIVSIILLLSGFGAGCALSQERPGIFDRTSFHPIKLESLPVPEAHETAQSLPEDRGIAALTQSLRRLDSFASVMAIVAHPDDEDGAMLTYESRGLGAQTSVLTLTRGEGGQNAMSADTYDALGLIRTNELVRADEFYGVRQYWGTEVDFGFSKTQEESFARWGHDRVLYDAVLAVRRDRPLVITSTFVGGITDGHGHHQVAGEIAQEVYNAAADPKIFPEQLSQGLRPWKPRAIYARTPFAPVTEQGMFDYATGKWAPARFYNYVSKEWTDKSPTVDVTLPVGMFDPILGRSYVQIAREGWGEQKSQNSGATPALRGDEVSRYHLYASRWSQGSPAARGDFFPSEVTSWAGLKLFLTSPAPAGFTEQLTEIEHIVTEARSTLRAENPAAIAPLLASAYRHTLTLREFVDQAALQADEKADVISELDRKIIEFQHALNEALGLDLTAFRTERKTLGNGGERFGGGVDESPRSVSPGASFLVHVHAIAAEENAKFKRIGLESATAPAWKAEKAVRPSGDARVVDEVLELTVPEAAQPTEPYFRRKSIEQPYYDLVDPTVRGDSFAPYPLTAWVEFDYQGLPVRLRQVVQTLKRIPGAGGVFEPLVITPAIGLRMEPTARILPLDGHVLPVHVTVHSEGKAEGVVRLNLPTGWTSSPTEAPFSRSAAGDSEPIEFNVKFTVDPAASSGAMNTITAEAVSGGQRYNSGWQSIGYPGLRPYNLYRPAELHTRKVDVKIAPGLRIGYVMGTGDLVPQALEGLGAMPHLLTPAELMSGDLDSWSAIVIGIRAYSVRPELTTSASRLDDYVRNGGTLIVQYQSASFPAPFPLTMNPTPERVVDESARVGLLAPADPLLTSPNLITHADFDGWVEERGHSFIDHWDPQFTALTETADAGQSPQRGGLLIAHPGKGTYIYCAFALQRQLPELVPGAYRLLANMVSSGAKARLHPPQ